MCTLMTFCHDPYDIEQILTVESIEMRLKIGGMLNNAMCDIQS